jgi:signal transduction histidine kinase
MMSRISEQAASDLVIAERAIRDSADIVGRLKYFGDRSSLGALGPVNLNTIVAEAAERARARHADEAAPADVPIEFSLALEIPAVTGDVNALREATEHLIVNALEATSSAGSIVIRTWSEAGSLYCSISDTGAGMWPEIQARAIEPFFTTKGVQRRGLGLSTSLGIIRAHDGELRVESEIGRGTTVTFRLPVAGPETAAGR